MHVLNEKKTKNSEEPHDFSPKPTHLALPCPPAAS